jgi:hypothetical protein
VRSSFVFGAGSSERTGYLSQRKLNSMLMRSDLNDASKEKVRDLWLVAGDGKSMSCSMMTLTEEMTMNWN